MSFKKCLSCLVGELLNKFKKYILAFNLYNEAKIEMVDNLKKHLNVRSYFSDNDTRTK